MHALKYLEEFFTYELMASIILGEGILTLHAYFIRRASEDTGDLPEVGRLASDRQSRVHSQLTSCTGIITLNSFPNK